MKTYLPVIALVLVTAFHADAETVYKWKDADGKIHYSDRPPTGDAQETERKELYTKPGDGSAGAPATAGAPGQESAAASAGAVTAVGSEASPESSAGGIGSAGGASGGGGGGAGTGGSGDASAGGGEAVADSAPAQGEGADKGGAPPATGDGSGEGADTGPGDTPTTAQAETAGSSSTQGSGDSSGGPPSASGGAARAASPPTGSSAAATRPPSPPAPPASDTDRQPSSGSTAGAPPKPKAPATAESTQPASAPEPDSEPEPASEPSAPPRSGPDRTGSVGKPPSSGNAISQVHFEIECGRAGVVGCRDFDSVEEVTEKDSTGAPNTPLVPLTNGKCPWNGGNRDCYPVFTEGDCSRKDTLLATKGRGQQSPEHASLYSPCYDSVAQAARLTYGNDQGSSIQWLHALEVPDRLNSPEVWVQYEIMVSEEFFFDPHRTSTSKLYRIERDKTDSCNDHRYADGKFLKISPEEVHIHIEQICSQKLHFDNRDAARLTPDEAGHWIRVTTAYDASTDTIGFWAKDVTTDTVLADNVYHEDHHGKPVDLPDDPNLKEIYFVLHATAHKPRPSDPSPNFWVRHMIVSTKPIRH